VYGPGSELCSVVALILAKLILGVLLPLLHLASLPMEIEAFGGSGCHNKNFTIHVISLVITSEHVKYNKHINLI
jgi:hypothetical protein